MDDEHDKIIKLPKRQRRNDLHRSYNYELIRRVAKQWPRFYKLSDIFFKYVSWLAVLAATKYIEDTTHDYLISWLYFIEVGFFVTGLMWLPLYLLYSAIYDDDHPIARSVILWPPAVIFALLLILFLTNPFMPLDHLIDRLEHRNNLSVQSQPSEVCSSK